MGNLESENKNEKGLPSWYNRLLETHRENTNTPIQGSQRQLSRRHGDNF